MVIVFVTDIFCDPENGTAMTSHRFAEELLKRGHEVRVLAYGTPGPDNYYVDEHQWGWITRLGHKNGFTFAKFNEETARRAFEGADIVHFLLPMPFEYQAMKLAKSMGIPCSAAYHMQPENFTYITHTDKIPYWSDIFYHGLNAWFFRHFRHIHCPSKFIANELKKHNYKGKLFVISNGVADHFKPAETPKPREEDGKFRILMTGRLSPEKKQLTLIQAMKYSKYADKIQIYFAGKGQTQKLLERKGAEIPNPPDIRFYNQDELIDLIHSCDLYVHTATVEIEAISCIEAFSSGLVPVICNSKKSATVQFARDERNLFKNNDPKDLAKKIDYWIEHPEERKAASAYYAAYGNNFRIEDSVKKIEIMFREAIKDQRKER